MPISSCYDLVYFLIFLCGMWTNLYRQWPCRLQWPVLQARPSPTLPRVLSLEKRNIEKVCISYKIDQPGPDGFSNCLRTRVDVHLEIDVSDMGAAGMFRNIER